MPVATLGEGAYGSLRAADAPAERPLARPLGRVRSPGEDLIEFGTKAGGPAPGPTTDAPGATAVRGRATT